MQRQPREQTRPRHVQLAGVTIDMKDPILIAATDAIGDMAEGVGIEIGRHQFQNRIMHHAVVAQGHVVLPRVENWPVVVHVRHVDAHDCDRT